MLKETFTLLKQLKNKIPLANYIELFIRDNSLCIFVIVKQKRNFHLNALISEEALSLVKNEINYIDFICADINNKIKEKII